jgi:starch phosphorylase
VPDARDDIDRAVAELAERLPAPLYPLARLAYDYRWSWAPGGVALFRDLDPALWERSANPRATIDPRGPPARGAARGAGNASPASSDTAAPHHRDIAPARDRVYRNIQPISRSSVRARLVE